MYLSNESGDLKEVVVYFKKKKTRRGELYANINGHEYHVSRDSQVVPKENLRYYALLRMEEGKSNGRKWNRYFADVKFRLFDLGEEKETKKKKSSKKSNDKNMNK